MLDENDIRIIKELLDENRKATVKDAVEQSMHYMNILYESKIEPQLKTLAEGHETLLQTLAPRNRVEALEEEVSILRSAMSAMSRDIAELKKAI